MLGLYTLSCDLSGILMTLWVEASGIQGMEWVDSIRGVVYEKWEGSKMKGRVWRPPILKLHQPPLHKHKHTHTPQVELDGLVSLPTM